MGWFDSPAIKVRKLVPEGLRPELNAVEDFASDRFAGEPDHQRPYQIGIVVANWARAAGMAGEFTLGDGLNRQFVAISDSCVKVLKSKSAQAFHVLSDLAEQGGLYGIPSEVFLRIAVDAYSYR